MSRSLVAARSLLCVGVLGYSAPTLAAEDAPRGAGRFHLAASAGPGYGWRVVERGADLPSSHESALFGVARGALGLGLTQHLAASLGVEGFFYGDSEIPSKDITALRLGDAHGEAISFGVDYQHASGWAGRLTTGIYEQTTFLKSEGSSYGHPAEVLRGLALGVGVGRRWELGRRWRLGVQLDVFGSPKLSGTFQTGGWFSDSYGVTGRVPNTNLELAITYD